MTAKVGYKHPNLLDARVYKRFTTSNPNYSSNLYASGMIYLSLAELIIL